MLQGGRGGRLHCGSKQTSHTECSANQFSSSSNGTLPALNAFAPGLSVFASPMMVGVDNCRTTFLVARGFQKSANNSSHTASPEKQGIAGTTQQQGQLIYSTHVHTVTATNGPVHAPPPPPKPHIPWLTRFVLTSLGGGLPELCEPPQN